METPIALILITIGICYFTIEYLITKRRINRGCLYGKTEPQKIAYFKSLYSFIKEDLVFYNEQYADLLPDEKEQFNIWLLNKVYFKKPTP